MQIVFFLCNIKDFFVQNKLFETDDWNIVLCSSTFESLQSQPYL